MPERAGHRSNYGHGASGSSRSTPRRIGGALPRDIRTTAKMRCEPKPRLAPGGPQDPHADSGTALCASDTVIAVTSSCEAIGGFSSECRLRESGDQRCRRHRKREGERGRPESAPRRVAQRGRRAGGRLDGSALPARPTGEVNMQLRIVHFAQGGMDRRRLPAW